MATFRSLDEKVPRGKVFGNELNLLITIVPEMHYCFYVVKINVLCHIFLGLCCLVLERTLSCRGDDDDRGAQRASAGIFFSKIDKEEGGHPKFPFLCQPCL